MSVKSFKFVSPGVFINEIDNSFIPKSAEAIGPVVIGRSTRGLAMQPVTVESYSEFVEMFGDTVPGRQGGDISRYGNYQSPMYGTYAAKAFLRANVAPLTYIRLLGSQDDNASGDGTAGWATQATPTALLHTNGGAYGLWVFASGGVNQPGIDLGTGSLAAVWYLEESASIKLSGSLAFGNAGLTPADAANPNTVSALGCAINTDANGHFTIEITGSKTGVQTYEKTTFGLDDTQAAFVRKRFNTNPQLTSLPDKFYPSSSYKPYWLGESYEQDLKWDGLNTGKLVGVMLPIVSGTNGPHKLRQASREAVAGWFFGQDLGGNSGESSAGMGAAVAYGAYQPSAMTRLFRLKGRGHGRWLSENVKVSIEKLRQSTSTTTEYGTFSVVLRSLLDTDSKVVVLERFDNLTLDPTSPDFVARRIGDMYNSWDSTQRRLKLYGEFPNNSKFVYVEMNADVEAGATDPLLLPFGYFGPPKFKGIGDNTSQTAPVMSASSLANSFINVVDTSGDNFLNITGNRGAGGAVTAYPLNGMNPSHNTSWTALSGTLEFQRDKLRISASDGALSNPKNAYWGLTVTRTSASTRPDDSVMTMNGLLYADFPDDPLSSTYSGRFPTNLVGIEAYSYAFTMNDIKTGSNSQAWEYESGSYAKGTAYSSGSYQDLLNARINRFTAPFWGGFDGFDIKKPDPMYNKGMTAASTDVNDYEYYTWKRALDTVADPEYINMNLMSAPGLTLNNLTTHMINVCEERADSLAVIDLPDVYIPTHEQYYANKTNRIGTTPINASNALKDRAIDSSYGCTFYPWVQTRDANTGLLLWVPPSVAMLGVLASSQASSQLWFAPAGFNRGGLTEGAAGIPVTGITERLTSKDRDDLYEARINPIASFPSTGIVVFGQKTLQERRSALDRINVRRLVIFLKKQISILSTQVLFEQNVQATWNRFKSLIEPFLANVKTEYGITDYKLILDDSTTTPDLIDQNIMYAKIMIKPARAIEYIAIDFVISSTGASFDD